MKRLLLGLGGVVTLVPLISVASCSYSIDPGVGQKEPIVIKLEFISTNFDNQKDYKEAIKVFSGLAYREVDIDKCRNFARTFFFFGTDPAAAKIGLANFASGLLTGHKDWTVENKKGIAILKNHDGSYFIKTYDNAYKFIIDGKNCTTFNFPE